MDPNRPVPEAAVVCKACSRRPAVCTPVVYVPIRNWPRPLYLQATFGLCKQCACAFTLNKFTDYDGAWYDMAADALRSYKVPAVNPFPDEPGFKWEEFVLNPRFDPVAREDCYLRFWELHTLAAKGLHQRIDSHITRTKR